MNTRRAFLAQAALAAIPLRAAEDAGIVDTHTHFYDPTRPQGVPWPRKEDAWLYRKVMPSDFRKLAAPLGIRGTIVVEASPWVEDNQWLLDLAANEPFILGIVGNLDPLSPDFATNLARFSRHPKFRGIRVSGAQLLQRGQDAGYLAALAKLADHGLSLDINGPSAFLTTIPALAKTLPSLPTIINHVGSAGDPKTITGKWRDDLAAAAQNERVFCKVSALAEQTKSEHGKAPVEPGYYRPILDAVWQAFGEKRLIFGSNWPVSDRGTSLESVVNIVRPYFEEKSPAAARRYFAENSRAAYRVG
jgi:L-fuconolactonase